MVRPNQEAIDTFISITGSSESIAVQKLEEYSGDLNRAVNGYFIEGDRNATIETSTAAQQDDYMDIDDDDDDLVQVSSGEPHFPLLSAPRSFNPFSVLNPNFGGSVFNSASDFTNQTPFVSHPREVREIPIEFKDGNEPSGNSRLAPTIVDITDTASHHGPEVHGTVIIDEDNDEFDSPALIPRVGGQSFLRSNTSDGSSLERPFIPSAPEVPAYGNDIEEEMIRAAIEASKRDVEEGYSSQQIGAIDDDVDITTIPQQMHSVPEDTELAHAVSLSLKTAELEKALREQVEKVGASEPDTGAHKSDKTVEAEELRKFSSSNGRLEGTSSHSKLEAGSSSFRDDVEDMEEHPLVRHKSRRLSPVSTDSVKEVGESEECPPSSPGQHNDIQIQNNENDFPSEWGGLSSEEHDEAVMLEAAMFGGIPEGSNYFTHAPHHLMRSGIAATLGPYPRPSPRPPSPNLTAQRLIREQQDDEYMAALQADRERELKAIEEAETRRLEEEAAREAVLEQERRNEEESRRKMEEEQEFERKLAAKEASLPCEPASDDENAVTLLVKMPDGSRRGRRFLRTGNLQMLFDFIDIGRVVKPGTYRLVRPYPRRAFSDGESDSTLTELGFTSKQEALYLELI